MKSIQKIAMLAVLVPVLVLSSCSKEFLERTPTTALDTNVVLNDPDLLPTTVVGSMSMFSGYGFWGRNAVVGGELMTDVATTMGQSGWLVNFEKWNIFPNDDDLEGYWSYCYAVAAASAQTVYSAKKILSGNTSLTESQTKALQNAIAVSDVIKAFCDFFLVQNFCVDINLTDAQVPGDNPEKVGIVLITDKPLSISDDDHANMYRLEDVYNWIERELNEAVTYFDTSNTTGYTGASEARYFPTRCAAYTLLARVYLAQHKYAEAKAAAESALNDLPNGASKTFYSTYDDLLASYQKGAATNEDIWTINYTNQTALSSNGLQNFFQAYNGKISDKIKALFPASDIRKELYKSDPGKTSCCEKYPNPDGIYDVPVMRVPELYLILAECAAANGNAGEMYENLFAILKYRDANITAPEDIASAYNYTSYTSREDMLVNVILPERVKELCGEGFRWSDIRRNAEYGARLSRDEPDASGKKKFIMWFKNYNLARWAMPIPYMETNTKQWANGKGVLEVDPATFKPNRFDKENWQNNAWDKKQGTPGNYTYSLSDESLQPIDGQDMANL